MLSVASCFQHSIIDTWCLAQQTQINDNFTNINIGLLFAFYNLLFK